MAKKTIIAAAGAAASSENRTPQSSKSMGDDQLWQLYIARVAKAETVNTMRRDIRAIFRDAFVEAKAAHEVWASQTEREVQ